MSKWVLSKEENVGQDFVELIFVASEKCRTGFCREGNRRTRLLSQTEIVKLVLSKGKLSSRVENLVLNFC